MSDCPPQAKLYLQFSISPLPSSLSPFFMFALVLNCLAKDIHSETITCVVYAITQTVSRTDCVVNGSYETIPLFKYSVAIPMQLTATR